MWFCFARTSLQIRWGMQEPGRCQRIFRANFETAEDMQAFIAILQAQGAMELP